MDTNCRKSSSKSNRKRWDIVTKETFEESMAINSDNRNKVNKSTKKSINDANGNISITSKNRKGSFDIECDMHYISQNKTADFCYEELNMDSLSKKHLDLLKNNLSSNINYNKGSAKAISNEVCMKMEEEIVPSAPPISSLSLPLQSNNSTLNKDSDIQGELVNQSEPISTIYCEKPKQFVLARINYANGQSSEPVYDTTKESLKSLHAALMQIGFKTFCIFCHGLLAGIALTQCILIFSCEFSREKFSNFYSGTLTNVYYAIIYFLTIVSFVSSCDRCDIAGQGIFLGHGIQIPWIPALYFVALFTTVLLIRSENILLHQSLLPVDTWDKWSELVAWWRIGCMVRTVMCVLAWAVLAPEPQTDLLLDFVHSLHHPQE